ncbi:hypothetical protein [Dactylosporangium sp. NPDC000521]|uniref:hypothetical protein n=1 Tax=Dactylosporangium sp. NPDC000521 TaxID=3363975 RepID=UPI0036B6DDE5
MNEQTQPITATSDPAPGPVPRTITHPDMRAHLDSQTATVLSASDRHRIFVRYDNVWWVSDGDGFIEIIDANQNTRLDRWHQRLNHGALWQ